MQHIIFQDLFAGISHISSSADHINLFSSSKYAIPMGLSAGIIHVVSGADHLVAMAPSSITNPKSALKNGLSWGIICSINLYQRLLIIKSNTPNTCTLLNRFK